MTTNGNLGIYFAVSVLDISIMMQEYKQKLGTYVLTNASSVFEPCTSRLEAAILSYLKLTCYVNLADG